METYMVDGTLFLFDKETGEVEAFIGEESAGVFSLPSYVSTSTFHYECERWLGEVFA